MSLGGWLAVAMAADLQVGPTRAFPDLQSASDAAQPGDRLLVDPGTYGPAQLSVAVELRAVEPGTVTVTASADSAALRVESGVAVELRGLVLDGLQLGRGLQAGAQTTVLVEDTVFQGGAAAEWGGCAHLDAASATFRRSTFAGCVAGSAGALYALNSAVFLEDVTVTDCEATGGFAGGVGVDTSSLEIRGSRFEGNVAFDPIGDPHYQALGGAIFTGDDSTLLLVGSTFVGNEARSLGDEAGRGGAVRLWLTDAVVQGCTFDSNVSTEYGSAIAAASSTLALSGSELRANLVDETLTSPVYGGALFCDELSDCAVDRSWFEGNLAGDGGAICTLGPLTVTTSMFCANETYGDAGAIDLGNAGGTVPVELAGNVFALNRAALQGGALVVAGGPQEVHNNHLVGNTSGTDAAIGATDLSAAAGLSVRNNLVAENLAGEGVALHLEPVPYVEDYDWVYENLPATAAFALGAGTGEGDPLLAGEISSCDATGLQLSPDSPLVDAGDPVLSDLDGSRADIGAFGGPHGDASAFQDADGDQVIAMLDCDDDDGTVFPGAPELCNGRDDDCDALLDADERATDAAWLYPDTDGDGAGVLGERSWGCPGEGWAATSTDCDDTDPNVIDPATWYPDADGDGWGDAALAETGCSPPDGSVLTPGDCDDTDPIVGVSCGDEDGDSALNGADPVPGDAGGLSGRAPSPDYGFGCATTQGPLGWWLLLLAGIYRFHR